jgi:aspartyl-tRNA(Asn)/glutamyl-tRNA(Gln) amidotransferase subunit A
MRAPSRPTCKRDGAVFLGKANLDEFAMGSSNATSAFGRVENPWKRANDRRTGWCRAAPPAVRRRRWRRGWRWVPRRRIPAAPSASRRPSAALPASSRPMGAVSRFGTVAFASSLDQAGPVARTVEDCAILLGSMAGLRPEGFHQRRYAGAGFRRRLRARREGAADRHPQGIPGAGHAAEIEALWQQGIAWLKDAGAEPVEISLPHTKYALPTYYIVAPAEASSNLARYDGVRFGLRENGADLKDLYERTRRAGFGDEVRRRIMIGTYVLSAGYYDAYYLKAQKVRALIKRDFDEAWGKVDAILTPATPSAAFGRDEKQDDPVTMYLNDVFTVTANLAGIPGLSVPAGLDSKGLPLGLQVIGKPFDEETVFAVGRALEQGANFTATPSVRAAA